MIDEVAPRSEWVGSRGSAVPEVGYRIVNQVGSHVVLEADLPTPHRLAVPNHRVMRVGTLNAILKEVAEHKSVAREELLATIR